MKNIVFTLLILLSAVCSLAQNSGVKDLRFNRLSVNNGMPGFQVSNVIQDKEDYMWASCINGLVRYDGYTTRVYRFGITDSALFVSTVYEDRKGAIWAGTGYNGLYRYDRANDTFYHYPIPRADSVLLSLNYITSIHDDKQGNLWLVISNETEDQLVYLNTQTNVARHFSMRESGKEKLDVRHIYSIAEDKSGRLWFGSDNGFYNYNKTENHFVSYFSTIDSLLRQSIKYICEDKAHPGTLWFYSSLTVNGVPKGLWQWNTETHTVRKFSHKEDKVSLPSDTVFSIQNDSQNHLWISTIVGLSLFDAASGKFNTYQLNAGVKDKDGSIYQWIERNNGTFWCRGKFGVVRFNTQTKQFTNFNFSQKDDETFHRTARYLFADRNKTLWTLSVSANTGIQWVNEERSRFAWYKDDPDNPLRNYTGGQTVDYAEAPDGTVWLASANGLYHWMPQTDSIQHIVPDEYRGKEVYVTAIRTDKEGMVWYGSSITGMGYQGLNCYNPKTGQVTHYKHDDDNPGSLQNNYVYSLGIDHLDNVWVGTDESTLCLLNRRTHLFTRYHLNRPEARKKLLVFGPAESILKLITFIYEDKSGILWVCSGKGGINQFDSKSGTFIPRPDIIPGNVYVACVFEDSKNRLWIGSYTAGVYCYDKKTNQTRRYTDKDGLAFNGAPGIVEDKAGNIWLSSFKGISIINPATNHIRTLINGKALPDDIYPYSFQMSNGNFLFSGRKGFIALNPDDYAPDTITPVVHIETVNFTNPSASVAEQKDSSVARWGKKEIRLSYDDNKVTFSYVGIHYQNATATTYAYRLDNYDKRWIQAGTDRTATYTSLNPGTYTFHVKAANGDGVWSKTEDAITIIIATPWWQTWWFYTLVALAAFGLIYLVYRYQLTQALKVQRVRNRIASDLHDEIGSTLSAITLFSQIAHDQSKTTVASPQLLQRINETAQKVTQTMRDIVWSVSTKNDSFDKMITHMHEHAAELLDLKGYELHFTADEKLADINLSMEKRQNIYLMYKEALNNIVKHAGGTQVWITIAKERKHLVLHLKDNGIGFDSEKGYTGNGLQNMQHRAASVHGSVTFHSGTGGSEVEIKVPV